PQRRTAVRAGLRRFGPAEPVVPQEVADELIARHQPGRAAVVVLGGRDATRAPGGRRPDEMPVAPAFHEARAAAAARRGARTPHVDVPPLCGTVGIRSASTHTSALTGISPSSAVRRSVAPASWPTNAGPTSSPMFASEAVAPSTAPRVAGDAPRPTIP